MTYQLIGLCLFILGFSYKLASVHHLEPGLIKSLQGRYGGSPYLGFFTEIWFLGRTTFTLIILILMTGFNWKLGLSSLAVFGIVAGLEKLVKMTFRRSRPYSAHKDIKMLQPQEPGDPSFPSGDALRVWFLALILTIAMGNSLPLGIIMAFAAALVSVGRMVLGVHYPTDVLAGIGLGFLGAGTTIWFWQMFNLL